MNKVKKEIEVTTFLERAEFSCWNESVVRRRWQKKTTGR
jgi:hypothetical protein